MPKHVTMDSNKGVAYVLLFHAVINATNVPHYEASTSHRDMVIMSHTMVYLKVSQSDALPLMAKKHI